MADYTFRLFKRADDESLEGALVEELIIEAKDDGDAQAQAAAIVPSTRSDWAYAVVTSNDTGLIVGHAERLKSFP